MQKIQKTISLSVLLPIIFLNFPLGMPGNCVANEAMAQMACCAEMMTVLDSSVEEFESVPCACHLSKNSKTEVPLSNPPLIVKPHSKKFGKNFESNSPQISNDLKQPQFSSTQFDVFSQPKFTLNLKIYIITSSYLI